MRTHFKRYLEKKNAQKIIDKFAKKHSGKKVILYGAGMFSEDLLNYYDLSKLNVIGISDSKFKVDTEGDFHGYKKISPDDIARTDFDILLTIVYDDESLRDFFEDKLFSGIEIDFAIETLIKMSFWDYVKKVYELC